MAGDAMIPPVIGELSNVVLWTGGKPCLPCWPASARSMNPSPRVTERESWVVRVQRPPLVLCQHRPPADLVATWLDCHAKRLSDWDTSLLSDCHANRMSLAHKPPVILSHKLADRLSHFPGPSRAPFRLGLDEWRNSAEPEFRPPLPTV